MTTARFGILLALSLITGAYGEDSKHDTGPSHSVRKTSDRELPAPGSRKKLPAPPSAPIRVAGPFTYDYRDHNESPTSTAEKMGSVELSIFASPDDANDLSIVFTALSGRNPRREFSDIESFEADLGGKEEGEEKFRYLKERQPFILYAPDGHVMTGPMVTQDAQGRIEAREVARGQIEFPLKVDKNGKAKDLRLYVSRKNNGVRSNADNFAYLGAKFKVQRGASGELKVEAPKWSQTIDRANISLRSLYETDSMVKREEGLERYKPLPRLARLPLGDSPEEARAVLEALAKEIESNPRGMREEAQLRRIREFIKELK